MEMSKVDLEDCLNFPSPIFFGCSIFVFGLKHTAFIGWQTAIYFHWKLIEIAQ